MDALRLIVLFNSISVIAGRWAADNGRLYAIEPRLRLKRSPPQAGLEPGTGIILKTFLIDFMYAKKYDRLISHLMPRNSIDWQNNNKITYTKQSVNISTRALAFV